MNKENKGIGGWLIVFIVWAVLNILTGIGLNLYQCAETWDQLALFRTAQIWDTGLNTAWYLLYAWFLYKFILIKPGSLSKIKIMVAATPIFNTLLPLIPLLIIYFQLEDVPLSPMILSTYSSTTIWSLTGAYLIAIVWLIYFNRSQRVKNTF